MTDPKLREARIAEAKRRAIVGPHAYSGDQTFVVSQHLIDVIAEDWRPEPAVDAVTLAAREWMKVSTVVPNDLLDTGQVDESVAIRAFRAGHADALANHPDTRRMDWLEGCHEVEFQTVEGFRRDRLAVRNPKGADLRTKIDRAMEGGE